MTPSGTAGWQDAWIGLGANLGDPVVQLKRALKTLHAHPSISVETVSSLYSSAPVGYANQPDFLNAVCRVRTCLDAHQLLNSMLKAESAIGRVRTGPRFGPRLVDLDLLLYGALTIRSEHLTLPHPRMAERRFVLDPLVELAPEITIPGVGRAATQLSRCHAQTVERVDSRRPNGSSGQASRPSNRADFWPGPGAFTGTPSGE